VRATFETVVADQVLQIFISRFGDDDFASWPHTRFGKYTVQSAYHLARTEGALVSRSTKGRGMTSDRAANEKLWKELWRIKVPGKMLINCLPSGQQLQHRQVPVSPICIHCSVYERVEHALLFCPFAREVWTEVKKDYDVHLNGNGFLSSKTWTTEFFCK
jgi:hypothetical protein